MKPLRIVSFGLGPIGIRAAALIAQKSSLELVGAIDIDPALAGKDLGAVVDAAGAAGVRIDSDARRVLEETKPDCVVHCTSSFIPNVREQLEVIIDCGANIITSTEEMLWPTLQQPEMTAELDARAKARGVSVLGTGVNPGFVMDTLPAFASSVCYDVRHVTCRRYVDATTRRLPFQKKIGAGMDEGEFRSLAQAGKLGHIGLRESIALLGAALGFDLDTIEQDVRPILATATKKTEYLEVPAGRVAGIHNTGFGAKNGKKLVEMDLRMYVGCEDPHDAFVFDSTPPFELRIPGGTSGDFATAAILVNGIQSVVAAAPGVRTMLDVAPPHLLR
ncbi:MAG: dihydrodipicolinate reductase [Planctomycetes bacterium]|nr:dihydrodipicolinate reductase [Planctomycetota bacterium]MCB9891286.1 dihydrodipicolinate reductase [Planctomycetota bacterium]MCB9919455.1 dihydrodipicolinate reductase [Planctomycetota bacterium]